MCCDSRWAIRSTARTSSSRRPRLRPGLSWAVSFDKGEFRGRAALVRQKEEGVLPSILRGLRMHERRHIPRAHYPVFVGRPGRWRGHLRDVLAAAADRDRPGLPVAGRRRGAGRPRSRWTSVDVAVPRPSFGRRSSSGARAEATRSCAFACGDRQEVGDGRAREARVRDESSQRRGGTDGVGHDRDDDVEPGARDPDPADRAEPGRGDEVGPTRERDPSRGTCPRRSPCSRPGTFAHRRRRSAGCR